MDPLNVVILLPLIRIGYVWPPLLKVSALFPAVLLPALAGAKYRSVAITISVLFLISSTIVIIMMPFVGLMKQTLGTRLALFDIEMAAVVFAMHTWWITHNNRLYAETLVCGALMWDCFATNRGPPRTVSWPLIMCASYAGLVLWLHWFDEYRPDDLMPGGSTFGHFVAVYMYLSAVVPVMIVASRTSDKVTIVFFSVVFCINTFVPAATMVAFFELGRIQCLTVRPMPVLQEIHAWVIRTKNCINQRLLA